MEARACWCSAPQSAAPAVLIPGGNEQTKKRDWNQAQNDAAKKRFDHGVTPDGRIVHNCSMYSTQL